MKDTKKDAMGEFPARPFVDALVRVSKLRKRNIRRLFRHIGVVLHLAYRQYAAFRLLDLAKNPLNLRFLSF